MIDSIVNYTIPARTRTERDMKTLYGMRVH